MGKTDIKTDHQINIECLNRFIDLANSIKDEGVILRWFPMDECPPLVTTPPMRLAEMAEPCQTLAWTRSPRPTGVSWNVYRSSKKTADWF